MNTVKNKGILIGLIIFAVFLTTFGLIFLKDKKEPVETPSTTLTVEQAGTINIGDQYKKIIINVPGVKIENGSADSILVASSVGEGEVSFHNVKTKELSLKGGGTNSITISGNSNIQSIRLERIDGAIRVVVTDSSLVENVTLYEGSQDVILEGNFGNIKIEASNIEVNLKDSTMDSLTILGKNTTVYLDKNSSIKNASILENATNSHIVFFGSINNLMILAKDVVIDVNGSLGSMDVKDSATNLLVNLNKPAVIKSINTLIPLVINGDGRLEEAVTNLKSNITGTAKVDKYILPTKPASPVKPTTPGKPNTGSNDSNDNNGSTVTPPVNVLVSAISVTSFADATSISIDKGTLQMNALVLPSNASNKAVTWSVVNESGSASINASGLLMALTNGTVTVKATAKDGSGIVSSKTLTISGQVAPDKNIISIATLTNINVANGTELSAIGLPTNVEVTLDDSTTRSLSVVWNSGTPAYLADTAGEYNFAGTLTLVTGVSNTSNVKASLKVIVAAKEQVGTPVISASTTNAANRQVGVTFTIGLVDGVSFYYTLDGTDPSTSSTKYTTSVSLTAPNLDAAATISVKVIGIKDGYTNSLVATKSINYLAKDVVSYLVSVKNGTGGGNYVKDAIVSISANPAIPGQLFDKWTTADGVSFTNENSINTTFTMPDKAVSVNATYKDALVTALSIKTAPTKISYIAGNQLDLAGLVVTLTKTDASTEDVPFADFASKGITTSPVNEEFLAIGNNKVTITHTLSTKSVEQTITVNPVPVLGTLTPVLTAGDATVKLSAITAESGYKFYYKHTATTDVANKPVLDSVPLTDWVEFNANTDIDGTNGTVMFVQVIKVAEVGNKIKAWGEASVTPAEISVTSISIKTAPTKTTYIVGDKLDLTGLVVKLIKSDASTEDVSFVNFASQGITTSPVNMSVLNVANNKVTITHTASGKSVEQTITVNPALVLGTLTPILTAGDAKVVLSVFTAESGYKFYYKHTAATDVANKPVLDSSSLSGWNELNVSTDIAGTNGTQIFVQVIKVAVDGNKIKAWGEASVTPTPISVTGVSLSQTTMSLKVGMGTGTLTATIAPANATNKTVTWTSSNTGVATVDSNGKVTPVTTGTATITVKTEDGGRTATCTVSVTAANIATQVFVGGGQGNTNMLDSNFPYWVNGAKSNTPTVGSYNWTAHFDHLTGILTLHNYTGEEISSGTANGKDFIVKLQETNTVTGTQAGVSNIGGGDIYITADNNATLNVITSSVDAFSYAIATGHASGRPSGSVVIGGKANVVVSATSTGVKISGGIWAEFGDVTIQEDARFTATLNADLTKGESIGIKAKKLTINIIGDIKIDCSNSKKGTVLYPNSLDIVNVNLMTLKAPTDGGFIFTSPVLPGVAVNIEGKVASYRSGTPYTLKVTDGDITGVTAGVVVGAGKEYQALENDTITIESRNITLFTFVKWTKADGSELDPSLFTGSTTAFSSLAKIKMLANDLSIKAQYKSTLFTTQPSFHRGAMQIEWNLSQAADFGYLQKKVGETWSDWKSVVHDSGAGIRVVSSGSGDTLNYAPDGTYRLKFVINSGPTDFKEHYSNEFEIKWDAQLDGTVTISGTPKYGGTLTAIATGYQSDAGTLYYQWYADSTKISGATGETLALTTDHIGKTIKVQVSSHNYNIPIIIEAGLVAKADGPLAIDSYTGTISGNNINLSGLGSSTANLEAAVAINGISYGEYDSLYVEENGTGSIFSLTGVNASTKVKVRIKATTTHLAGDDKEITVTALELTPSTIVFANGADVSKITTDENFTNTVSGDGTGTLTYTSGTPGTATINSSTGEVTIVGVGTTVITAVKAATATHATVTSTYTLTVTAAPLVSTAPDTTHLSFSAATKKFTIASVAPSGTYKIFFNDSGTADATIVSHTNGNNTISAVVIAPVTAGQNIHYTFTETGKAESTKTADGKVVATLGATTIVLGNDFADPNTNTNSGYTFTNKTGAVPDILKGTELVANILNSGTVNSYSDIGCTVKLDATGATISNNGFEGLQLGGNGGLEEVTVYITQTDASGNESAATTIIFRNGN